MDIELCDSDDIVLLAHACGHDIQLRPVHCGDHGRGMFSLSRIQVLFLVLWCYSALCMLVHGNDDIAEHWLFCVGNMRSAQSHGGWFASLAFSST